ncbi:type II secretion system F family protein [Micromonospora pattaloongensis]|uniref:type II secretion system F family protein n=1 Tax=Micromonospora pattaloongensis TaxID=405436 RepID=UPI001587978E|nr:type II secretion system F family protein [Micromonospora pattaloongensis]
MALVLAGVAPVPARAEVSPNVIVTGVQASTGAVEFFLAARHLPPGVTLAGARIGVRADGVELASTVRQVAHTDRATPVRAVVLVVDASGSMRGARLTAARAAAADYAAVAPPGVRLGLVTVATRPTVALAPTADRAAFAATVARISADGDTALYDGVAAAARLLDPAATPAAARYAERRIVVLSDGADTTSGLALAELQRDLARGRATVDAVAFGASADLGQLASLTDRTGGQTVRARDQQALRAAFRAMAAEVSAPVVVTAVVPPELGGRSTELRVTVTLPSASATATTPVTFRMDPRAAAGPARFSSPAARQTGLLTALASLAAGVLLGGFLLFGPLIGRSTAQRRLATLDQFVIGRRAAAPTPAAFPGAPMVRAAVAVGERSVSAPGRRDRIELALDRAGSSLRAAEWQAIRLAVTLATAVLLALVLPWWLGAPLGLLAGWIGTGQYLRLRAARRSRRFADQLPDALQLLVSSLRAGFSLQQAIDALVREGEEPVAGELGRALAETRLGGDLEDALERVGERNSSRDMAWLVMAIRIQREVGGNLSEVLETAVTTMRERARLGRHVRALSAEGRLSALVLLGMPIVLAAWMFAFRRDYLRPLYTQPLGLMMLFASVVMMVIGGLWLRKLVRVEV